GVQTCALPIYYVSSKLFDGDFDSMNKLFMAMVFVLGSVIIGTYFFYKGSVTFITNIIRKNKGGYVNINDVLSLTSIMFRMKSNAFLLTVITTVSALAIGLLSLSYISFYSAEKNAESTVPNHFALTNLEDATLFKERLEQEAIAYNETKIEVLQVNADLEKVMDTNMEEIQFDIKNTIVPVVSDKDVQAVDVAADEMIFTGQSEIMDKLMSFKDSGELTLKGQTETIEQKYIGLEKEIILPYIFTAGGFPVAVVDESIFTQLKHDIDQDIQIEYTVYIGIDMNDHGNIQEADDIFQQLFSEETSNLSRLSMSNSQKQVMGLMMFI